ncbi:class I SAM-dependent methyltransferase [Sphingomonas baiyangensis]|nr:class I SAM-dependent methyltransferase [Sphingomonas baiyangensis]
MGHLLCQPHPTTGWHRHPALFAAVRDLLAGVVEPRLLSYGCSTGEEALSLYEVLPNAHVTAIDINPRSIRLARRLAARLAVERVTFVCAGAPPDPALIERFDAVFCLSVLRHARLESELPESCAAILPFARAQLLMHQLDDLLKPGGYLVMWGSNFRLCDTDLASRYATIPTPGCKPHCGPFYTANDRRADAADTAEFVFRKRSDAPNDGL